MAVRHETELYGPLKAFFERRGYDVKGEVMHCDMVAVKPEGGETVIVEMKKTFTLALLLQGVERLRISDRVVLAVERNRSKAGAVNQRFGDLAEMCRMLGIGLMTVTFFKTKPPVVDVLCEPGDPPVRGMRRKRQSRLAMEFRERSGDYNVGGSTKRKLVTAYREKALRCAWALREHGTLAPRQLADFTGFRAVQGMLRNDVYGWFERVERGVYRLRPAGEAALAEYADVVAAWLAGRPAGADGPAAGSAGADGLTSGGVGADGLAAGSAGADGAAPPEVAPGSEFTVATVVPAASSSPANPAFGSEAKNARLSGKPVGGAKRPGTAAKTPMKRKEQRSRRAQSTRTE